MKTDHEGGESLGTIPNALLLQQKFVFFAIKMVLWVQFRIHFILKANA